MRSALSSLFGFAIGLGVVSCSSGESNSPKTPSLTASTVVSSAASLTADGTTTATITVQLKDANGGLIAASGGTLLLQTTGGTIGGVTDHANGSYTATLTAPTTLGSGTISAQLNGQALTSTATVAFVAGAADMAHSTLTVADSVLVASGSSTTLVTVRARDGHDNPVTTGINSLTIAATAGVLSSVTAAGGGVYTATLTTATALVTAIVSAQINAQSLTTTATVRFKIGPPAAIAIAGGNNQVASVLATLPAPISVTVSDGFGHATVGSTVVFAIAGGGGSVSGSSAVTDAAGHASVGSWSLGSAYGANTLTAIAHLTDAASPVAGSVNITATAHLYHYAQSYDGNHATVTVPWAFASHYNVYLADETSAFYQNVTFSVLSNDAGCSWTTTTITCPLGTNTANVTFQQAAVVHVANPSFVPALALPVDPLPRITFMSDRSGSDEIYVMNPDGTGLTRLTNDAYDDLVPVWSPDRHKITWYSTNNNASNHVDVWTMNADGSSPFQVTTTGYNGHPDWSPDGTKIAYQCAPGANYQICTVNPDGSSVTVITNSAYNHFDPEWSPDGLLLLHDTFQPGSQQLGIMSNSGTGLVVLTTPPGINRTARWSPDGTKIVFTSTRDGNDEIYIMNADGSGQTRLTNDAGDDDYAAFSADGTEIIFGSTRTGTFQLYTMSLNGANLVRLTNSTGNDRHPNWH